MRDNKLFANWNLIKIPAIITLVVTLARFVAELAHAPKWLANSDPGGGGALLGIAWLVPIFGIYFAIKLVKEGKGPTDRARSWEVLLACLVVMSTMALVPANWGNDVRLLVLLTQISIVAILLIRYGWRELADTLLGYAIAARVPVIAVMAIATFGKLQSHYNGYPEFMGTWSNFQKILFGGVVPQLTFWLAFTAVAGTLLGLIATAFSARTAEGQEQATAPTAAAARAAGSSS